MIDGTNRTLRARTIVNATGPWIDVLNEQLGVTTEHRIAHSKGIHLIVPRIGSGERVFAFFDEDERLYYVWLSYTSPSPRDRQKSLTPASP